MSMPTPENPFTTTSRASAERAPGTGKNLGKEGARLYHQIARRQGQIRQATSPDQSLGQLLTREETEIIKAYEQRERLFDAAKDTYSSIRDVWSANLAKERAVFRLIKGLRTIHGDVDSLVQTTEQTSEDQESNNPSMLPVGYAYSAAGRYQDALEWYTKHCPHPNNFQEYEGWFDFLNEWIAQEPSAVHTINPKIAQDLTILLESVLTSRGIARLDNIYPILHKLTRLMCSLQLEGRMDFIHLLAELEDQLLVVDPAHPDRYPKPSEEDHTELALLEIEVGRIDRAEEQLRKIRGPASLLQVQAAIAKSPHISKEVADTHLKLAIDNLVYTFHPGQDYGRVIEAIPHDRAPNLLPQLETSTSFMDRPHHLSETFYEIMGGYLRINDQTSAQRCLDQIENQLRIATDKNLDRGDNHRYMATYTTAMRARSLMSLDIHDMLTTIATELNAPSNKRDLTFKKATVEQYLQIIDLHIEQGLDPEDVLRSLVNEQQKHWVMHGVEDDKKDLFRFELLKRQTAWAVKQCQHLDKQRRALLSPVRSE